jgi:hypothetical protein
MSDSPQKTLDFSPTAPFHACLNRALAPGLLRRLSRDRCALLAPQRS